MKQWGNSKFATPEPYDEVMLAVAEHDCGWDYWEKSPKISPQNKYPKNFLEMNYSDQAAIWKRSFLKHSKKHPYASALIALHFDKFNTSILKKNKRASKLKAEIKEFVIDNLKLTNFGKYGLDDEIINNLKFVQIGDIISLALCHGWRSTQIDDIPYRLNGKNTSIMLLSEDGLNYKAFPFPFSKSPVIVSIKGKVIYKKTFNNNSEFFDAFKNSDNTKLTFTITE